MFGKSPRSGDKTGPVGYSNPQDNTKFILEKIEELDKKLTRRMLCKHENYSVVKDNVDPLFSIHLHQMGLGYRKVCDYCGIDLGECGHKEKAKREYEIAKQKVEQFEESQLKEPEELPAETTEFRGNFSAIRYHGRLNKVRYILRDALDEKERIDSGESDGTRTDCHNILFKAVEQALLELSKD